VVTGIAGSIPLKITTQKILLQSQTSLTIGWAALNSNQSGGLSVTNYVVTSDNADFIYANLNTIGQTTSFTKIVSQPGNEGKIYRFRVAA